MTSIFMWLYIYILIDFSINIAKIHTCIKSIQLFGKPVQKAYIYSLNVHRKHTPFCRRCSKLLHVTAQPVSKTYNSTTG